MLGNLNLCADSDRCTCTMYAVNMAYACTIIVRNMHSAVNRACMYMYYLIAVDIVTIVCIQ